MVAEARRNASGQVVKGRTGELARSVVPILRPFIGGDTEIGVGTTLKYGQYLEEGTELHVIAPRNIAGMLASDSSNPSPLRAPRRFVIHPGNDAKRWLHKAVFGVLRRTPL